MRRKYTELSADKIFDEFPSPFRTPVFELTEEGIFLVDVVRCEVDIDSEDLDPSEREELHRLWQEELKLRAEEDAAGRRKSA